MIQDIGSNRFDISFVSRRPSESDAVLVFDDDGKALVSLDKNRLIFPTLRKMDSVTETVYLFSVDNIPYFLAVSDSVVSISDFIYRDLRELRGSCENLYLFIVFTAYHLWRWYKDNKMCGRCGHKLESKTEERALVCRECGNTVYPRINPAVIVGVIKGDSILVTRYRAGYKHNALVAGFTEIGETLEQTVEREVMEETGVKVKNIRYYKSQPWGMAQDILVGFFCEADGNGEIHMDENELRYAAWVSRDELELQPNDLSLTNEMMKVFKSEGKR